MVLKLTKKEYEELQEKGSIEIERYGLSIVVEIDAYGNELITIVNPYTKVGRR